MAETIKIGKEHQGEVKKKSGPTYIKGGKPTRSDLPAGSRPPKEKSQTSGK